jgi:hemoglobin
MAGGPCSYIGRPMQAAHAGLGITEADWEGLLQHVAASLDQLKIAPREQQEFLALFSKMKMDIVEADGN